MKTGKLQNGQEFEALSIRELHKRLGEIIAERDSHNDMDGLLDLPIVIRIGRARDEKYAPLQLVCNSLCGLGHNSKLAMFEAGDLLGWKLDGST